MSDVLAEDDVLAALPDVLREHVEADDAFEPHSVADKGQNGVVVFGRNSISGKEVAWKYYYWIGDHAYHAEPRKLASINHKNVVKLEHAGYVNDEYAFFIMPRLTNGDLDNYIQCRVIDLRKAISFTFGLVSGVSELHAEGLLHRDLKPANILLSEDGEVVIADFGSVKQLPEEATGVPGSGHSILYRPPESVTGFYSKAGDIYQCGIVLYQLLGGSLPYEETDWLNPAQRKKYGTLSRPDQSLFVDEVIMKRAAAGRLLDFGSLPVWVPNSIRTIIRTATAPDPTRRYATASDLSAALHETGATAPAWIETAEEVSVEDGARSFRVVTSKIGLSHCEKKVTGNWRNHKQIPVGARDDVVAALRRDLGI